MSPSDRSAGARRNDAWRAGLVSLALVVLTLAAFLPLFHNDFIKFDDRQYVTENPHVVTGLTWANVRWAFRTGYASNWHPLTWISHMLDVRLFGLNPAGHHFTNLLLHLANTLALFFLLRRMTGCLWRSAMVAGLFAVHPLHVESVAWVAERKDVLSTFFFLLTLWFYTLYAQRAQEQAAGSALELLPNLTALREADPELSVPKHSSAARPRLFYSLALVAFALGLMSKPMLVTVPFLLLLLDWWPLGRLNFSPSSGVPIARLLWEKLPFLLLTVCSSVVTYLAQAGSHSIINGLPLRLRVANAIVSYSKYLGKTFWPLDLAVFYPHPNTRYHLPASPGYPVSEQWPWWLVVFAVLLLLGLSAWAVWRSRRQPWLVSGWFWFGGMLVPVIGLVQIGMQGMADRYTYIPLIGVFICLVWGAAEWLQTYHSGQAVLAFGAALVVLACCSLTYRQVGFWRNNFTLFDHALRVTQHNAVALCNVGEELAQQGKLDLAQQDFLAAAKADPRFALVYMDLGISFELHGKPALAADQYEAAVRLRPWNESGRLRLAGILTQLGRRDEALQQYAAILEMNPAQASIHYEMGRLLAAANQSADALSHFEAAVRLKPDYLEAFAQMGALLAGERKFTAAQAPLRQAVRLCPTNALLHLDLGKVLMLAGKNAEAAPEFRQAARLAPGLPEQLVEEGRALCSRGQPNAALVSFNTALWLKPDSPEALSGMAWMLATHPVAKFRNGPRALHLAQRALELSGGTQTTIWAALDAAFAENGRFPEAIAAAEKCRELAATAGDQATARACDARLALYQNQRPFRQ